jgi:hypothetical protein
VPWILRPTMPAGLHTTPEKGRSGQG